MDYVLFTLFVGVGAVMANTYCVVICFACCRIAYPMLPVIHTVKIVNVNHYNYHIHIRYPTVCEYKPL